MILGISGLFAQLIQRLGPWISRWGGAAEEKGKQRQAWGPGGIRTHRLKQLSRRT